MKCYSHAEVTILYFCPLCLGSGSAINLLSLGVVYLCPRENHLYRRAHSIVDKEQDVMYDCWSIVLIIITFWVLHLVCCKLTYWQTISVSLSSRNRTARSNRWNYIRYNWFLCYCRNCGSSYRGLYSSVEKQVGLYTANESVCLSRSLSMHNAWLPSLIFKSDGWKDTCKQHWSLLYVYFEVVQPHTKCIGVYVRSVRHPSILSSHVSGYNMYLYTWVWAIVNRLVSPFLLYLPTRGF